MAGLISRVEFAQLCGITPQGVHRAIKRERVHLTQGKVDPDHPTNRHYREQSRNRGAAQSPAPAAPPPPAGPKSAQPPGSKSKKTNGLTEHAQAQLEQNEIVERQTTIKFKNEADLQKTIEQHKALQLKNDAARNQLISRDLVKRVFGELYQIETTELLTLGEKISPEIAALFGLDDQQAVLDVGKVIQKEISKTLEHVELTIDKFLKSFQVEGI